MTDLKQAFAETREQLDKIILAYRRGVPLPHPETLVWYRNDTLSSFNIEGELGQNSIPDKRNAVKVEIGTAVTSIGLAVFDGCSGLTSITIPNSVTRIGTGAFGSCSSLSSITIPNSIMSISDYAFTYCSSLTSITCQPTIAPTVQIATFGDAIGAYTGYPTRGNNVLKIPRGATGYDSGAWLDPLQNASKCGFHIEYI